MISILKLHPRRMMMMMMMIMMRERKKERVGRKLNLKST